MSRAVRLGQPLFMQIPKAFAASTLAGCALVAILASRTASTVAFGPFFLLICAFGAWFVGNRFAILLGLFIVSVQIQSGNALVLTQGPVVTALQICSALAVVLMLGVARAALEIEWRFARFDPLTGAFNRKAFFEAVGNETSPEGVTVLVFADIDGLKPLNDRRGHEAGDEALRDFADRVRKTIRKNDVFARIGGDEFVIFLSVGDIKSAEIVAQRLNTALNMDPTWRETRLKCSLGVLVLPAGSRSIDVELKQADSLMYHAKRDRTGLMMAISNKGGMHAFNPSVQSSSSPDQKGAEVRLSPRSPRIAASDGSPGKPLAA